jgi:hypothetical protein
VSSHVIKKSICSFSDNSISRRCKTAFSRARKQLPRPLQSSNFDLTKPSISHKFGSFESTVSLKKSNAASELWRKTVQDQQKFKHLRIFVSELPATPQSPRPRKPRYHSRAKERLEAAIVRAEKNFTSHLVPTRKLNLGTIYESPPNSPPLDNHILASPAPMSNQAASEQPKSITGTKSNETLAKAASPALIMETQFDFGRLPPRNFTSKVQQANPTRSHFHGYPATPPETQQHNYFTPATYHLEGPNSSSRSMVSAPSDVFGNWDILSSYSGWSNASAPDGHYGFSSFDFQEYIYDRLDPRSMGADLHLDRTLTTQAITYVHS